MSNPRDVKKLRKQNEADLLAQPSGNLTLWADIVSPLAIFFLAFSVRLLYLSQIKANPLFYHLVVDARSYDEWAQRIAAGDWLGQGVFYQAPLYPYFLGLLQLILGRDLWSIRVVQITLGALSCSLLYWAGKAFFSRGAGIAAGFILSLYAPAIFFDGLIQKTVLDLLLITLLLFVLSRTQLRSNWTKWTAIGVVVGLLGLTRENALVWVLPLPIWIWFYFVDRTSRVRLVWIGAFLIGLTMVLFPVGLRNLKMGGEFALTTSQFGPNFFIGNNPDADGTYTPLRPGHGDPQHERQDAAELAEQAVGRSLSPREVSHYWLQRSWNYIRSQPLDWFELMGRKWLLLWNVRELEDADDFYLYQEWSWLLKGLGAISHFGFLAPLAAVGFMLTWRQWRKLWLLYALLGTLVISIISFYVFGRYRFPMVPVLTLFAGAGLGEGFALFKGGSVRQVLWCAAALLLSGVLVYWPLVRKSGPSATGYSNMANALAQQGRIAEAIESLQRALQVKPNFALAHYNLGNFLAQQGKLDEAKHHLQEAISVNPGYAEAHNNLGSILAMQGELKEAIQHFRQALKLGLAGSGVHFNLGTAFTREGYFREAMDHFQQAVKLNPRYAEAHHYLGRVVAAQGQLGEAVEHFRDALRIQPEFADAHESLGRALAQQGKRDEAVKHYQEALRIMKSGAGAASPR